MRKPSHQSHQTVVLDFQSHQMPNRVAHDIGNLYARDTIKHDTRECPRQLNQPSCTIINECLHYIHINKLPVIILNSLESLAARLTHITTWEMNIISKTI